MVSIFSVQYRAFFLFISALIMPLNVQAFNRADYDELLENPSATYLYCDKDRSPIADVIAEVSKLDADENSPVWQLKRHIENGSSIGLQDAIVQALEYAERVVSNLVNNPQIDQIHAALNSVIDQVVDGSLLVDLPSVLKSGLERSCCGTTSKTIKVREKLYVLESAKFFKDVEFKQNVVIEGSLSVADETIGCDLTVGCNINMVNSTDAAHGNVLKAGLPFISNFGTLNTFVGVNAGNFTMTGAGGNTGMGVNTLTANTTGTLNSAFGVNALAANTTGVENVAVGAGALQANITGFDNTAVGSNALINNLAAQNTAVGSGALNQNTTGVNNVAIGFNALQSSITGSSNTAVGTVALEINTADLNTAVGFAALQQNTTGFGNTVVGANALTQNTTGTFNTAVGFNALQGNTTGVSNTAVGTGSLIANTIGLNNAAVGGGSLQANTTGANNTAVGTTSLIANTTGINNTAVGFAALIANINGINNVALGSGAGSFVTGNNNVSISHPGVAVENGAMRIGSLGTQTSCFIQGISGVVVAGAVPVVIGALGQLGTVVSSKRFKHDIAAMDVDSENIYKLEPVSFVYNADASNAKQFGLIAEEVARVFPEIVVYEENGQPYTVQYQVLPVLLLNEMKKHQASIEALVARVALLEERA